MSGALQGRKRRQMPPGGGGVLKLRFDWYTLWIRLEFQYSAEFILPLRWRIPANAAARHFPFIQPVKNWVLKHYYFEQSFLLSSSQQNEHCDWLILGHMPLIKIKCIPTGIWPGYSVQLLPARRLCFFVFAIWKSKYITKHLMYGPLGN